MPNDDRRDWLRSTGLLAAGLAVTAIGVMVATPARIADGNGSLRCEPAWDLQPLADACAVASSKWIPAGLILGLGLALILVLSFTLHERVGTRAQIWLRRSSVAAMAFVAFVAVSLEYVPVGTSWR